MTNLRVSSLTVERPNGSLVKNSEEALGIKDFVARSIWGDFSKPIPVEPNSWPALENTRVSEEAGLISTGGIDLGRSQEALTAGGDEGEWVKVVKKNRSPRSPLSHLKNSAPRRFLSANFVRRNRLCFRCGGSKHMAKDCRDPIVCFRCQEVGHEARNCRSGVPGHGSDNSGRGNGGGRGFGFEGIGRNFGGRVFPGGRGNGGRFGGRFGRSDANPWQWQREKAVTAFSSSGAQDRSSRNQDRLLKNVHLDKGKRPISLVDSEKIHDSILQFQDQGPRDFGDLEAELKISGDHPRFSAAVLNFEGEVNSGFQKFRNYAIISFVEGGNISLERLELDLRAFFSYE
ncbi:uncharacterized protein LOC109829598 [Asparagus officinalis]|uniref:uncharacterized protein LOC109829598 n=1 Tax=Asparagus officinalis TaxID=4686 RepID=UPI00098E2654|nr:uncharacterized protein LOC109829598 [Asparagus officinalis]